MSKVEMIGRYSSPGERRHCKRQARRARRRAEKKDVEDAPIKVRELTRGWND